VKTVEENDEQQKDKEKKDQSSRDSGYDGFLKKNHTKTNGKVKGNRRKF